MGDPRAHPPAPAPRPLSAALAEHVCAVGREAGLDAVGIAPADVFTRARRLLHERKAAGLHAGMSFTYRNPDRSTDPGQSVRNARAVVVGAFRYRRSDVDAPDPGEHGSSGRIARYATEPHYVPLRNALTAMAAELKAAGHKALVVADENGLVDREAAYRAGIGWFGKNANILIPGAGSWFVLGSVITSAPLPATAPEDRVPDGCGACVACIDACPTGAIVAPGVVDARRCLAWLVQQGGAFPVEFRAALGDRIYGCDDCQEVCPPNRIADRRHPPVPPGDDARAWAPLVELLRMSDDELLARHGRWYIADRDPRHLRRNALIALGNVAPPDDAEARHAIQERVADTSDALLSEHARWALARLAERTAASRTDSTGEGGFRDPAPEAT